MRLKKATFYYTVFFLIIIILTYIFIEIINERNLIKNQISINSVRVINTHGEMLLPSMKKIIGKKKFKKKTYFKRKKSK